MIHPRIDVHAAKPVEHGGSRKLVQHDFSVNVNAWGSPPAIGRAVREAAFEHYPDSDAKAVNQRAAVLWNMPVSTVGFFPGAADILFRLSRAYLVDGDAAIIVMPGFGEYARAVRLAGAECRFIHMDPHNVGSLSLVASAARECSARLVFIASPGSPTGQSLNAHSLQDLADSLTGLLVLDESFHSFAAGGFVRPLLAGHENVVHVKSITKDFALGGVRAGFACAHADVIEALFAAGPPWATSTAAQAAALAAMQPESMAWLQHSIMEMRQARDVLVGDLRRLGLYAFHSDSNYICVPVREQRWIRTLHEAGIVVRDCASLGLPGHARIAVRRAEENAVLVTAIELASC